MKAHIFIDAENVRPEIGIRAVKKFCRDYSVDCVDVVGKEDTISSVYKTAGSIFRIQNCYYGKNIADTWLCVEIAKTIYENPENEVIIIISNDKDFLPSVKLAVEKKKTVLFVSNGAGHKNLTRLLKFMKVDLTFVQLIDYHLDLTIPIDEGEVKKKRSLSELMKNVEPAVVNPKISKLESFYMRLSDDAAKFLKNREEQIRFIFIKRGNNFREVPFITGMSVFRFTAILRELKVIGKKVSGVQAANENFLKIVDDRVCFYREEELVDKTVDVLSKFPKLSKSTRKFFSENARRLKTVFINHAGHLAEVPFINGMILSKFAEVLRELKVIGKNAGIQKVVKASMLDIRENRVYLYGEEDLSETLDENTRKVANFLAENKDEIKKIFVKVDRKISEVPFVNGMNKKMFFEILKHFRVTNKIQATERIISDSCLDLIDGNIFFQSEEKMLGDSELFTQI